MLTRNRHASKFRQDGKKKKETTTQISSHSGGEVQTVQQVPHQQRRADSPQRPAVEAHGHREGDEQHVKSLAVLVGELG